MGGGFPGPPWRTVVGFGVVSLAADIVYEGARSVAGPLIPQSRRSLQTWSNPSDALRRTEFAAVQGAAAIAGGVMAGALYERSLPTLITAVVLTQIIGLILLIASLRRNRRHSLSS